MRIETINSSDYEFFHSIYKPESPSFHVKIVLNIIIEFFIFSLLTAINSFEN